MPQSNSGEDVLTLTIRDLAQSGAGVAREESGRVIFVPLTAPGDVVRARIIRAEKRYAEAELVEVIQPSPHRQVPRCAVFGRCGGCQWQHIPYEMQWQAKIQGVRSSLGRRGLATPEPWDLLPAERVWEYRNRVQLRGEVSIFGFYARASNTLVPIERCEIARPEINAALPRLRVEGASKPRPYKLEIEVTENGQIREIWNAGHAAMGFRQIHDEQNEKLRKWVAERIPDDSILLDLFGGSGNLSSPIATRMKEVHCVDVGAPTQNPHASAKNLHFHRSAVLLWLMRRANSGTKWPADAPISAILDPPREGLSTDWLDVLVTLEKLGVKNVVAVGCDADAWAQDLTRFHRRGWKISRLAVLDLFPQTAHVEGIAHLLL